MIGRLVIASLGALLAYAPASAAPVYSQFIAFGDSTLDSGWWKGALATPGQCDGAASPCGTGNPTRDTLIRNAIANGGTGAPVGVGLMHSEVLAGKFGLTAIPANQPGGTNYAISGSKTAVFAGTGNLYPNANLPSTVGQIDNYLTSTGGTANSSALYVFSSGGNDLTYANQTYDADFAAKQAYLTTQINAYVSKIDFLQSVGAKNILVEGVQPSGPLGIYYNDTLRAALNSAEVDYIYADVAGLIATVTANPTAYGFTADTVKPGINGPTTGSACVAGAGSGWGQWCANKTSNGPYARLRSVDSEETSFFSDDAHLSAAGQRILAEYEYGLLQAAVPEPSTWATMILGFAGMGFMAYRRKTGRPALQ
nr:SGNH/GDSL hydrolase family protein [Bradyrhizobium algeriense]